MTTIRLPHNWQPRSYQRRLWAYLEKGGKRAVAVWHRRAGKDDVCLHWAAIAAHERVGTYWHLLPEASQARKAIWDAVNPRTGLRRIDEAFPHALRDTTREQDMLIRFKSGSTWQVVGSDNYNSLVGSPPVGVVFSEWALADPEAWAYIRPILRENDGWGLWIYTPRGRNHGAGFFENAASDPAWFAEKLDARQTAVFTEADLEAERREYLREFGDIIGQSRFRQEYFCDFDAVVIGSYYGKEMAEAEEDGRICGVPYEPISPVNTAWDLGIGDTTAIWFFQQVGREIRVVDFYEASGVGLDHYAKILDGKRYKYGEHLLPHDAAARELGTGRSRLETLQSLGLHGARVVPRLGIDDGINAVRTLLPRCWFDEAKCKRGIEALRQYRAEWDDKAKTLKPRPLHDWASHPSDSFRTLAVGLREITKPTRIVYPSLPNVA